MFLFWVIICIEIDTVRERETERGRAEDCDANVNGDGDSDVDSLPELERQFRFQLWPTIRDTVKYSGDNNNNKNNNRSSSTSTLLLLLLPLAALSLFRAVLAASIARRSVLCGSTNELRLIAQRQRRRDYNLRRAMTTTTTARAFKLRFVLLLLSVSLTMLPSSQCSLNSRSLAKSCLRHMLLLLFLLFCKLRLWLRLLSRRLSLWHMLLLLLFLLLANFGFDYVRALGVSLVAALHSLSKTHHTHHDAMSKLAKLSLAWLLIDSAHSLTPSFTC